jgi:predicted unusual protein kinase regulating ubiquinone biosynthesis (AarF/ABC1/UbiB family)
MELSTISPELPQLLADMGIAYDPDRLAASLSLRPTALAARAALVASSLGGFVAAVLADMASGRVEQNAEARAGQLRKVLARLGPSFIKVGQALSGEPAAGGAAGGGAGGGLSPPRRACMQRPAAPSLFPPPPSHTHAPRYPLPPPPLPLAPSSAARPDLLPKPYLEALSQLQDRLPSFPTPVAHALIEEELGRPLGEVFSELSPRPVAAASLGQVYKGVLRATGEAVAVKVQRPGIGESIAVDMVLLRRLIRAVDTHVAAVQQPLLPLVDEFASRLFAELDYVREGHSAERFASLYAHVPRVRAPRIVWSASARRVLTMEWIDGVKLTDAPAMEAAGLDVVDFVTVGVECTLRQLLEAGFFHAVSCPAPVLVAACGMRRRAELPAPLPSLSPCIIPPPPA